MSSSVEINAPVERVWAVATDLAQYPCWNPFFTSARGKLAPGEELALTMQPVGGSSSSG